MPDRVQAVPVMGLPETASQFYSNIRPKHLFSFLNNQYKLYLIHRQTWMLRTIVTGL